MEHTIVAEDGCLRTVEFVIPKEEFEKEYNSAIKSAQAYANLPGFRKGKVPANIIKQRFGESIEYEAIEKLANDSFKTYTEKNQIKLSDQPTLVDVNKETEDIKVRIKFESFSDFELQDYKGLLIDEPVHIVNEEEIEHSILHIRIDNATQEPAEEITDEFYGLELEVLEKDENGEIIQNENPPIDRIFLHDHHVDPEIPKIVINQKVGFEFDYLNVEQNKPYRLKIKSISKYILPELNAEFIKAQTEDRLETIEDFKEDIGFGLQEKWAQNSVNAMQNQIMDKLIDLHDFPVPQSAVEMVAKNMFEDYKKRMKQYYGNVKMTFEEMRDKFIPDGEKAVKWELIRDRIIEAEGIQVEDYDIENHFAQFLQGMDVASIKKIVEENPNLKTQLLAQKVLDLLIDFSETREVDFNGNPLVSDEIISTDESTEVAEEVK